jgi:hypothetical protein
MLRSSRSRDQTPSGRRGGDVCALRRLRSSRLAGRVAPGVEVLSPSRWCRTLPLVVSVIVPGDCQPNRIPHAVSSRDRGPGLGGWASFSRPAMAWAVDAEKAQPHDGAYMGVRMDLPHLAAVGSAYRIGVGRRHLAVIGLVPVGGAGMAAGRVHPVSRPCRGGQGRVLVAAMVDDQAPRTGVMVRVGSRWLPGDFPGRDPARTWAVAYRGEG